MDDFSHRSAGGSQCLAPSFRVPVCRLSLCHSSKRNSPDPAFAPSPIGSIACLAPRSDEPPACLTVAAPDRPRIHHNAKLRSPVQWDSTDFLLGASLAILTALDVCSAFLSCFSKSFGPGEDVIPARDSLAPAEPFLRQRVPDRSADVPHLRIVAIKSSFALSRRYNSCWAALADAFLGASFFLFPLCNAAYCDDAACRQARCMPPCSDIPPQASNCISIIHRCCDLLISPHTICVVIQCLQGPHLHLEFGTELLRPHSTTPAAILYITLPYAQRPRHLPASCCSRRSRRSPAACTCGEYACVK